MTTKTYSPITQLPTSETERIRVYQKQANAKAMSERKQREQNSEIPESSIFEVVDTLVKELQVANQRIERLTQELSEEQQAHRVTAWNLNLERNHP